MPFVSFEGIDGSGKSVQAARLADRLEALGHDVVRTREPSGGPIGNEVRSMMTREDRRPLDAMEEFLLVSAARNGHVREIIAPALARGAWVVCDRFVDSTFAFQVHGGDVPVGLYERVTLAVTRGVVPDRTIVLDLAPSVAAGRRKGRVESGLDPTEATRDFERIRAGLLAAAALDPSRCVVLDAAAGEAEVAEAVWRAIGAPRDPGGAEQVDLPLRKR